MSVRQDEAVVNKFAKTRSVDLNVDVSMGSNQLIAINANVSK